MRSKFMRSKVIFSGDRKNNHEIESPKNNVINKEKPLKNIYLLFTIVTENIVQEKIVKIEKIPTHGYWCSLLVKVSL